SRPGAMQGRRPPRKYRRPLLRAGGGLDYRTQCAGQRIDGRLGVMAEPVPLRKPTRIVVGQPRGARLILPDKDLEREIDSHRLSAVCAGAPPNTKGWVPGGGPPPPPAPAAWSTGANTASPLAFTSASSRFTVLFGSWLLRTVIKPSAAMACTPVRQMNKIKAG